MKILKFGLFYCLAVKHAISISEVIIVIASDDTEWCKANLVSLPFNVEFSADHTPGPKPYAFKIEPYAFDMAALSACSHNIMDYGTFGFWAGTLCPGRVYLLDLVPGEPDVATNTMVQAIKATRLVGSKYRFLDWQTGRVRSGCGAPIGLAQHC